MIGATVISWSCFCLLYRASPSLGGCLGTIGLRRFPGEGNDNSLQCSCLENPKDGGAWWAAVYRVTQSQTRLKQLIAKLRLKLKNVGEITRLFRFDLNQIPYNYTLEVTNRFKGLYLIECLKNYGQRSWHPTGGSDQDYPQEKEMQKGKIVAPGGLTNS